MFKISSISICPPLPHHDRKRFAVNTEASRILSHDARGHETDDPAFFILRQTARARRQPKITALIRVGQTLRDLARILIRFAEAGDRVHKSLGTIENIFQVREMVRRYTDLLIRVRAFLRKLLNDPLRQAPNSNAVRIDAAPVDAGSGDKPAAAQRQDVTEQFRQSGVYAKSGVDFVPVLDDGGV